MSVKVNDRTLQRGFSGNVQVKASAGLFIQSIDGQPATIRGTLSVETESSKLSLPGVDQPFIAGASLEDYLHGRVTKRKELVTELQRLEQNKSDLANEAIMTYGMSDKLIGFLSELATSNPPMPLAVIGGTTASDKIQGSITNMDAYINLFESSGLDEVGGDFSDEEALDVVGTVLAIFPQETDYSKNSVGTDLIVSRLGKVVFIYAQDLTGLRLIDKIYLRRTPVRMDVQLTRSSIPVDSVASFDVILGWLMGGMTDDLDTNMADSLFVGAVYSDGTGEVVTWSPTGNTLDLDGSPEDFALFSERVTYFQVDGPVDSLTLSGSLSASLTNMLTVRGMRGTEVTEYQAAGGLLVALSEMMSPGSFTGELAEIDTYDLASFGVGGFKWGFSPYSNWADVPIDFMGGTAGQARIHGHVIVDDNGAVYAYSQDVTGNPAYYLIGSVGDVLAGSAGRLTTIIAKDGDALVTYVYDTVPVLVDDDPNPFTGYEPSISVDPLGDTSGDASAVYHSSGGVYIKGVDWAIRADELTPTLTFVRAWESLVDVTRLYELSSGLEIYQRASGVWAKVGSGGISQGGDLNSASIILEDETSVFVRSAAVDNVGDTLYKLDSTQGQGVAIGLDVLAVSTGSRMSVLNQLTGDPDLSIPGLITASEIYESPHDGEYIAFSGHTVGLLHRPKTGVPWVVGSKLDSDPNTHAPTHVSLGWSNGYTLAVLRTEDAGGLYLSLANPSGLDYTSGTPILTSVTCVTAKVLHFDGEDVIVSILDDGRVLLTGFKANIGEIRKMSDVPPDVTVDYTYITPSLDAVHISGYTDGSTDILMVSDGLNKVQVFNVTIRNTPKRIKVITTSGVAHLDGPRIIDHGNTGLVTVYDRLMVRLMSFPGGDIGVTNSIRLSSNVAATVYSTDSGTSVDVKTVNSASKSFTYTQAGSSNYPLTYTQALLGTPDGFSTEVIARVGGYSVMSAHTPTNTSKNARRLVMNFRPLHKRADLPDGGSTLTTTITSERLTRNSLLWLVGLHPDDVKDVDDIVSAATVQSFDQADYESGTLAKTDSLDQDGNSIHAILDRVGADNWVRIPGRFFGTEYDVLVQNKTVPVYVRSDDSTYGPRVELGEYLTVAGNYSTPGYSGVGSESGIKTIEQEDTGSWWDRVWVATRGTDRTMARLLDTRSNATDLPQESNLPTSVNAAYLLLAYITKQNVAWAVIEPTSEDDIDRIEELLGKIPVEAVDPALPLCTNWIPIYVGDVGREKAIKNLPYT